MSLRLSVEPTTRDQCPMLWAYKSNVRLDKVLVGYNGRSNSWLQYPSKSTNLPSRRFPFPSVQSSLSLIQPGRSTKSSCCGTAVTPLIFRYSAMDVYAAHSRILNPPEGQKSPGNLNMGVKNCTVFRRPRAAHCYTERRT